MSTALSHATALYATRPLLSTADIRKIAIDTLRARGRDVLDTIEEIHHAKPDEIRTRCIEKTLLEPIAKALNERGQPVAYEYGAVADLLALPPNLMRFAFCTDEGSASMRCDQAADLLESACGPSDRDAAAKAPVLN